MSVADGVFSGNPWLAIGTALYRGIVGSGPRRFFGSNIERILAAQQQQNAAVPGPVKPTTESGTLRTVSDIDNSPTRRRTPGGPGYRPPSWQVSPLPGPWNPPETDQEFEDFERDTNAQWRGFVGPVPTIPDTLPRTFPASTTVAGTVARVLARAVALPWLIFFPSRTADDDTIPGPMPQPLPQPRGPSRRPRVRVRTIPDAPNIPGPYRPAQPRFPGDFERPGTNPDTVTQPQPGTRPAPSPAPVPRPDTRPRPAPTPRPTPTPRAPSAPGLPFWLPLLPQLLPRVPSRLPNRPLAAPLTPIQRAPVQYPQPLPLSVPIQARPSNCPPCETERKRRKRKCTNRITNRRTFTRGGSRFRTITRKLEC